MDKFTALILLTLLFASVGFAQTDPSKTPSDTQRESGVGAGSASGTSTSVVIAQDASKPGNTKPFRILAKPRALYTEAARKNDIEGSVRLKVTLLASGEVGSITPVTALPYGLTEQAIAAARQLKFTPKTINGIPVTVIVTFEYGFSFMYSEDDKEVAEKAKIIEMPDIEFPPGDLFKKIEGKLGVRIVLPSNGPASLISIDATVSENIEQLVRNAVAKIVFEPAKRIDGRNISIIRKVFYEFKPKK